MAIRNYPNENSAIRSAVPENPTLEQNMTWIGRPVTDISPFEILPIRRWPPSWICSNRKERRSIRRPRKSYPRTKHEVDRITRCRDMAIRVCWGHMKPQFWGEGEVVGGHRQTDRQTDDMRSQYRALH